MTTQISTISDVSAAVVLDEAKDAARRDVLFRAIVHMRHSYIKVFFCGEGQYLYWFSGSDQFVSEDEARALIRISHEVPL